MSRESIADPIEAMNKVMNKVTTFCAGERALGETGCALAHNFEAAAG